MALKHKIRIQLLDDEFRTVSDRLVSQYEELLNGPAETHKGPVKIEFTLDSLDTQERLTGYLAKLAGQIPISQSKISNKVTSTKGINPYKEIYLDVKKCTHMEDVIDKCEELNFRWITDQYLHELPSSKRPAELPKGYQWLCRMERQAKDPANDKFDFTLMFGIKFMGSTQNTGSLSGKKTKGINENEKLFVFYKGAKKVILIRPWRKESNINLKKKKIALIFPTYMTIEERKKWRALRRKVELGKELGNRDKQFYERYLPEIQNLEHQETATKKARTK